MVKIVIDAMGGDYAPREQVLSAVAALKKDKDLSVILCGDETQIKAVLSECKYDDSRVEIVHTTEVITMEEIPTKAVKAKKDSSTVVAFRLLKEGKADGLVSSGSTGAVLTAGGVRGGGEAAEGDVVKSHDAQLFRDAQSQLPAVDQHAVGQQVVAADNGGAAGLQNAGKMVGEAVVDKVLGTGQSFVCRQAVGFHRLEKSVIALLIDVGFQLAAEIADFGVTQLG